MPIFCCKADHQHDTSSKVILLGTSGDTLLSIRADDISPRSCLQWRGKMHRFEKWIAMCIKKNSNKKARGNNNEKAEEPASFCDTATITTTSGTPPTNGVIGALLRTLNFLKDESTENEACSLESHKSSRKNWCCDAKV